MSRYNGMMEAHFAGRPLLGEMEDPNRGRTLKAFYIDEDDKVGVSDGVDAWIAPADGCLYQLKLPQAIEAVKSGREPVIPRRRIQLTLDGVAAAETIIRRKPVILDQAVPRRRLIRG